MDATAPANQVHLFENAPRDYLDLGSLDAPYLVSYYIDETFHTTWIVRGRTKFRNLKGEDGITFTISDHQFSLPKVEAVLMSELPEYFGILGPGVDIILGRDFLTSYSFLFFRRSRDGLQLSKSCINRCKWPTKLECLNFYTAWYINETDKSKAGTAAFVNICSPFSTWRPYKPCYWDPQEDISLCAMTQAMKTATQIPPFHPGPIINIITNDQLSCETYSPFLKIRHSDLENSRDFHLLKPRLKSIVNQFLEYRKIYAEYNELEELSCVHLINHQKQEYTKLYRPENLECAYQLAKLGSKMKEYDAKGQLGSQLPIDQYYHFDTKTEVCAAPRKETNKTLRKILGSYQQSTDKQVQSELSEYVSSEDGMLDCGFAVETSFDGFAAAQKQKHLAPGPSPTIKIPAQHTLENGNIDHGIAEETSNEDTIIAPKSKISTFSSTPGSNIREYVKRHQFQTPSHHTISPELTGEKLPNPALTTTFRELPFSPSSAAVPNIEEHTKYHRLISSNLQLELDKLQKNGLPSSNIRSMFDRLKDNKVTNYEKSNLHDELAVQLEILVKKSEEKGLKIIEQQRRNCDLIMAGAHQQQNELTINTSLVVRFLSGFLAGYLYSTGWGTIMEETQGAIDPINDSAVEPTSVDPPHIHPYLDRCVGNIDSTAAHEDRRRENPVTIDARTRLAKHRLDVEKLRNNGKLPKNGSTENEIMSIDYRFTNHEENIVHQNANGNGNCKKTHNTSSRGNENTKQKPKTSAICSTKQVRGNGNILEVKDGSQQTTVAQKRSTFANVQTEDESRKPSIFPTINTREPRAGDLSARYPGGALNLANTGGVPGNRHNDYQRQTNTTGGYNDNNNRQPKIPNKILKISMNPTSKDSTNGMPLDRIQTTNSMFPVISPKELADMTELPSGRVLRSLNRSMGTVAKVMERCPELRDIATIAANEMLGYHNFSKVSLNINKDEGLGLVCNRMEDQQCFAVTA